MLLPEWVYTEALVDRVDPAAWLSQMMQLLRVGWEFVALPRPLTIPPPWPVARLAEMVQLIKFGLEPRLAMPPPPLVEAFPVNRQLMKVGLLTAL